MASVALYFVGFVTLGLAWAAVLVGGTVHMGNSEREKRRGGRWMARMSK